VIAAHLPVSAFAILTFRRSFWKQWNDRGKLLLQLLHCWTWPNLLFWTLVPNHNVRYALPMSAGLMGLGVMGLVGWLKRSTPSFTKEGENPRTVLNPSPPLGGSRGNPWGVHPPKPGGVWEGSEQAEPNPPAPFGPLAGPVSGASRGPAKAEGEEELQSVLCPSPFRGGAASEASGEGSKQAEPNPPAPFPKAEGGA